MSNDNELEKNYLANGGSRCPYCDSENISAGHSESDGISIFSSVTCNECDKSWTDIYTLMEVDLSE